MEDDGIDMVPCDIMSNVGLEFYRPLQERDSLCVLFGLRRASGFERAAGRALSAAAGPSSFIHSIVCRYALIHLLHNQISPPNTHVLHSSTTLELTPQIMFFEYKLKS